MHAARTTSSTSRRAHRDLRNSRDVRGDRPHHDRARIRRPAAWGVDGGARHRDLAHDDFVAAELDRAIGPERGLRDPTDVGDRQLEARPDGGIEALDGSVELIWLDS
jgi:hypothetical protein